MGGGPKPTVIRDVGPDGEIGTTMNGSIFAIEARGSGAHRAPLSRAARVRRFAAGVVISALTMLGLQASPAWAAAADISKGLGIR